MLSRTDAITLYKARRQLKGESLTYADGTHSVSLVGIPTKFEDRRSPLEAMQTTTRFLDFLLLASEIVLNSVETLPQAGHTIKRTIDGSEVTYLVTPAINQDPVYEFHDTYEAVLRVHTERR